MSYHISTEESAGPAGWRLWPMFPAVCLFIAAGTLQNSLIGYQMALTGWEDSLIGLLMAAYFGGLFAGAFIAPRLIGRFGHFRAFSLAGLAAAAAIAAYRPTDAPAVWAPIQLFTGSLVAVQYVAVESWLNRVAGPSCRARLFGFYMVFWFLGAGGGPLLMALVPDFTIGMALVALMMLGSGLVMLPLAVRPALRFPVPTLAFAGLYRKSPAGAAATFLVGLSFGAAMGMTAAYGEARGFDPAQISLFVAAFVAGGAVTQYPIGHLADHMDRARLLTLCAALSAAGSLPLFFDLPFAALSLAALAVGAFSLPLYTLGVAMVQDRTAEAERVPTAGGLLILNSLGSFIGPLAIGGASDLFGPNSLFALLAGAHLLLACHGIFQSNHRLANA